MALQVIGSGLGRTGTKSLQTALAQLGFGPCHHMVEVFAHPETMPLWIAAGEGNPDWQSIFAGYRSAVDYPSAAYWRELTAHYPDAKVVHTVRDAESWFESTQATIFRAGGVAEAAMAGNDVRGAFFRSFIKPPLLGRLHDRAFLLDYFERHTEAVKAAIPADRLLIYEISEGWQPLCDFLGVAVPDKSAPMENTRAEFIARANSAAPPGGAQR
jgi:hypothetical protein